jgi:hypothetical protein
MHISLVNINGLVVFLEENAHNYENILDINDIYTILVNINGLVIYLEGNVHNYNIFLEIALTSLPDESSCTTAMIVGHSD